ERASPSDLLCLQIANSGGIFRGCSENRKRRLLAFNQNCFAERAPTGQPQSRRAHSCAVNARHGIRKTARKKYRVILGSAFCSDFETRVPTSRMHSSFTAIHHRHEHQVRCSAVGTTIAWMFCPAMIFWNEAKSVFCSSAQCAR